MTPTEFLLWEQTTRDTIDLKKIYIDIAGDIVTGVLLSQIIYWNLPNKEGETKLRVEIDGELWLAKGRDDWWEECRISPKQFDRSIKILENKNIVTTKLKKFDASPTKHIRLNLEILIENISNVLNNQGSFVFAQRSNSILPKGKKGNSSKGKKEITQKVKTLTENTTEITSEEKETFTHYEDVKGKRLTKTDKTNLSELLKTYSKDIILKAIEEMTIRADIPNIKYLQTTLEDWHSKGLQTIELVEKHLVEREVQKTKVKQNRENAIKRAADNKPVIKKDRFTDYDQRNYTTEQFADMEQSLITDTEGIDGEKLLEQIRSKSKGVEG